MGVALFIIGLVAILVACVMLVIALVRKKGWGVVRSLFLGIAGVVLTIVGIAVVITQEVTKPDAITPATPPTPESTVTPNPPTAQEAITIVRTSPEASEAVAPFKQELEWKAEWVGDRWCVVGLFESPWGVKFVSDATIWDGRVYAYIDYGMRPKYEWVQAKAREWGLQHLYTRLTPDEALSRVKKSDSVRYALQDVKVIDGVAELVEDSAVFQSWRFVFYVVRKDGRNAILAVEGFGGKGAEEGNYVSEYGFGNATEAYYEIPLHLSDWARAVAKAHGWEKVANLP